MFPPSGCSHAATLQPHYVAALVMHVDDDLTTARVMVVRG